MPIKVVRCTASSHARPDACARGMVWGMHVAKAPRVEIPQSGDREEWGEPSKQCGGLTNIDDEHTRGQL